MAKKYKSGSSFKLQTQMVHGDEHTILLKLIPNLAKVNLICPCKNDFYISHKRGKHISLSEKVKNANNPVLDCTKAHRTYNSPDFKMAITKTLPCIRCKASLTVEAAMVVPVFVLCLVLFLGFFRVLLVETQVNQALSYTAEKLAIETMAIYQDSDTGADELLETGMQILNYGKEKLQGRKIFIQQLNELDCPEAVVEDGWSGISITNTASDEQYIRLTATYQILLPINIFGKDSIEVSQTSVARRWNGFQEGDGDADQWVYITPFGTAYHKGTDCPYLDLSVWAASNAQIASLRNHSGGKYYECVLCNGQQATDDSDTVYVTDYGTLYHKSLECKALKRTVMRVAEENVQGRSPCQKCY